MRRNFARFSVTPEMLGRLEFFQELDTDRREAIGRLCEGRLYDPSSEIIRHGETSCDVYFLLAGKAQVTVYSSAGRVITFDEICPGVMFGELAAIDRQPRVASVIAVEESHIIRLPDQLFMELVTTEPSLVRYTLRRLSDLVRRHCERIFEFHALPVPARVRAEFLRLAEAQARGQDRAVLSPRPIDQDLANRVGTNREQVNRERHALIRRGLLEEDGSTLVIPSLERLRRKLGERLDA